MFAWLKSLFGVKIKSLECDHIYFPVMGISGPIGQECAICHRFNSVADVESAWARVYKEHTEQQKQHSK